MEHHARERGVRRRQGNRGRSQNQPRERHRDQSESLQRTVLSCRMGIAAKAAGRRNGRRESHLCRGGQFHRRRRLAQARATGSSAGCGGPRGVPDIQPDAGICAPTLLGHSNHVNLRGSIAAATRRCVTMQGERGESRRTYDVIRIRSSSPVVRSGCFATAADAGQTAPPIRPAAAAVTLSTSKAGARPVTLTLQLRYNMQCAIPARGRRLIIFPVAERLPAQLAAGDVLVGHPATQTSRAAALSPSPCPSARPLVRRGRPRRPEDRLCPRCRARQPAESRHVLAGGTHTAGQRPREHHDPLTAPMNVSRRAHKLRRGGIRGWVRRAGRYARLAAELAELGERLRCRDELGASGGVAGLVHRRVATPR